MDTIILDNRNTLQQVSYWIEQTSFEKSYFQYGVPQHIKHLIDREIGNELSYTDLLVYIGKYHLKNINYFEIGVSLGKNFYQLLHNLNASSYTAFDIENINPVLKNELLHISKIEWEAKNKSLRKEVSYLDTFSFQDKKIYYLSGDVLDETNWERLSGEKYNLIFSDALHDPKAILFEFDMIMKYKLLSDQFVFFWDDLHPHMEPSFYTIIKKYGKQLNISHKFIIQINGWIGIHEKQHPVGIITNLPYL